MMKRQKKMRGIESVKSRYGLIFVAPWIVGLILFFAVPLLKSFYYAFSSVSLEKNGISTVWAGFENFNYVWNVDSKFTTNLLQSITSFFYSFPLILILSLLLAVFLNQKFRGKTFFRVLYFLPVIIATGVVMELILTTRSSGDLTSAGVESSLSQEMISISDMMGALGLPSAISRYLQMAISSIMDLVWNSGIQIVLFISGMQSIPDSLYEVSKVEGATKWEEFWFITLPMLSWVIVLVSVFTIIELMTAKDDAVMAYAYRQVESMNYGYGSAMLWIYFLIIGVIVTVFTLIFKKIFRERN